MKSNILKPWLKSVVFEQLQVWEDGKCHQVVPGLTHSPCHMAGLRLHRPTLSVSVSELMLISLCSKFLNCSCFFPCTEISFSLMLKYAWAFYLNFFFNSKATIKLSAWNEIQPLSDMRVAMIVWVCLKTCVSVSFALTAFTSVLTLELIDRR